MQAESQREPWSIGRRSPASASKTSGGRKPACPAEVGIALEVRARRGEQTLFTASVEPFGVGEVFVVAGQSYAVGANDEVIKVDDPQGRVAAYDVQQKTWRVAHDPQPNVGDGGTIWPTTGDLLLPALRVPVGFVNAAVGGTATRQWLPGEKVYEQLSDAGKSIGRFRAVLWQQGESDVIEHRSTEYYVENLTKIRQALRTIGASSRPGFWPRARCTPRSTTTQTAKVGSARRLTASGRRPDFAPDRTPTFWAATAAAAWARAGISRASASAAPRCSGSPRSGRS